MIIEYLIFFNIIYIFIRNSEIFFRKFKKNALRFSEIVKTLINSFKSLPRISLKIPLCYFGEVIKASA